MEGQNTTSIRKSAPAQHEVNAASDRPRRDTWGVDSMASRSRDPPPSYRSRSATRIDDEAQPPPYNRVQAPIDNRARAAAKGSTEALNGHIQAEAAISRRLFSKDPYAFFTPAQRASAIKYEKRLTQERLAREAEMKRREDERRANMPKPPWKPLSARHTMPGELQRAKASLKPVSVDARPRRTIAPPQPVLRRSARIAARARMEDVPAEAAESKGRKTAKKSKRSERSRK